MYTANINIQIVNNYKSMCLQAATLIKKQLILKPTSVLGLATGSTMLGVYQEFVKLYEVDNFDLSQVTTFNLDEYYPISPEHPDSYHQYMETQLFSKISIPHQNTHIPEGDSPSVEELCLSYEADIIEVGGIDFQLLGIGCNGHIGFNEPGSLCESRTRLVTLEESTRIHNSSPSLSKPLPHQAITMGIQTIMKAKKILLLISGKKKSKAVYNMLKKPISNQSPASILRKHPCVKILMDKEAASCLDI